MQGFENAERERRAAQEALVSLQLQGAMLDPEGVIAGLRGQINNVEMQLHRKRAATGGPAGQRPPQPEPGRRGAAAMCAACKTSWTS